jgi:hypothetical protein
VSHKLARCRSCGEFVIWTDTERGKRMPVDAKPLDVTSFAGAGEFVLRKRERDTPLAVAVTPAAFEDEPHYVSHFATCPDADKWRRPR